MHAYFVENDYLRLTTPVMDRVRKNGRLIVLSKADTVVTCEVLETAAKRSIRKMSLHIPVFLMMFDSYPAVLPCLSRVLFESTFIPRDNVLPLISRVNLLLFRLTRVITVYRLSRVINGYRYHVTAYHVPFIPLTCPG